MRNIQNVVDFADLDLEKCGFRFDDEDEDEL
jgi:hypothetical protein